MRVADEHRVIRNEAIDSACFENEKPGGRRSVEAFSIDRTEVTVAAYRACVEALHAHDPEMLIVVLTGFASIATAVEAIKRGATHYLTKPADVRDIVAAFDARCGESSVTLAARPTPLEQLEWEHIQRTLIAFDGNISATAKHLGLHRRTLQRKLQKRPSGM